MTRIGDRYHTLDAACDAAMAVQEPWRSAPSLVGCARQKLLINAADQGRLTAAAIAEQSQRIFLNT
jgi:hypothetical protein